MLGIEFREDRAGFGSTVPGALRDLAAQLETLDITVWVRRSAKQYRRAAYSKQPVRSVGELRSSRTSIR
jgi:hypothetical protein